MCQECREKRGDMSGYKFMKFPLPFRLVYFAELCRGRHDLGTKARCLCGCEYFIASNPIQGCGPQGPQDDQKVWIAKCSHCHFVYVLPWIDWDAEDVRS